MMALRIARLRRLLGISEEHARIIEKHAYGNTGNG